jgi:beta-phosphoglucomutase
VTAARALQAIILDFDGVIADSEPLHLRAFQATLADHGLALSADQYYSRYLGYDDLGMLEALARDRSLAWSAPELKALVAEKGVHLQAMLQNSSVLFPGAAEFIRSSAAEVPIGIASGAMKHEILQVIQAAGLAPCIALVVAAGDTPESKPSPAPYRLALEGLRERTGLDLDARRSVAVEDSRWGLASASGAGLRCVGVTSSYPAEELPGAELVVGGLADLTLDMLHQLCSS